MTVKQLGLSIIGLIAVIGVTAYLFLPPSLIPWYMIGYGGSPDQGVTPEEFASLMNQAARRHQQRTSNTPPSKPQQVSDTGINRTRHWRDRFDSTTVSLLEQLEVSPASPRGDTNFATRSLTGDTVVLTDFRGHWRLLNFWASWCAPCREEMPAFDRLQQHFADRNFTILGINIGEPRSTVRNFVEARKLNFTILLDPSGRIGSRYGTFTLPETWIIDPAGNVVGVVRGPRRWDQPPAKTLFKRLTE